MIYFLWPNESEVTFAARVTVTIISIFGWSALIVLYLAFFAGGFGFWQKAAIFIASGAIVFGAIVSLWASWALRHPGN